MTRDGTKISRIELKSFVRHKARGHTESKKHARNTPLYKFDKNISSIL